MQGTVTSSSSVFISRNTTRVLKGIAIVFVILGHRHVVENGGAIGVQLFLMLSGYGLYKSVASRGAKGYWRRRFVGVMVPYGLFMIFQMAIQVTLLGGFSFVQGIVSLVGLDFGLNIDPCMWYISFAYYWYAWFWIGVNWRNRSSKVALAVLMMGALIVVPLGLLGWPWRRGASAQIYFWSFPLGVLLARYEGWLASRLRGGTLIFAVIISACLSTAVYAAPSNESIVNQSLSMLVQSAFWTIFLLLVAILLTKGPEGSRLLAAMEYVGSKSYAMYLNEGLFMRLDPILGWTSNPLITLIGSFAVAKVFDRFISEPIVAWVKARSRL